MGPSAFTGDGELSTADSATPAVAVIGGGPAGLMAADVLVRAGVPVEVYDAMPSVGRKFLLAGKGGLNLTHSEPLEPFLGRYETQRPNMEPLIRAFSPADVRAWARALGIETFEGSSGRVFPVGMKAAPLLRSWLHQLRSAGVRFHVRHRWLGWNEDGSLRFATPAGERQVSARQVVLALGGASWPQLGSDGEWVSHLAEKGVAVGPLQPANCGFDAPWSDFFRSRFAGEPVKSVVATFMEPDGHSLSRQGDLIITASGVEGGLIYALSRLIRETLAAGREAVLHLDLAPGKSVGRLTEELARPRGSRSLSSHLKRHVGLDGVKAGLLRERLLPQTFAQPAELARAIKALPLPLLAPRPIAEAISSAGGVRFEDLDGHSMIRALPGVFCAGEMLDWEAPTGGYLLNACLASGRAAGLGVLAYRGELLGPPRAATADRA